ncbi:MAG TPA: GNAT family N-acetyltransferase [Paludibacter sp.]
MELLQPQHYQLASEPLSQLPINQLFARVVVEGHVSGKIYVDNAEHPTTFLIAHPYGMSLLFGNENNERFNEAFVRYALNESKQRQRTEWLQVYPTTWNEKLSVLLGDKTVKEENRTDRDSGKVELSTRVNFAFNREKYLEFKSAFGQNSYEIVRTDKHLFEEISGTVVPKYFWNSADEFVQKAIGFSLLHEGEVASTAFSAFIIDNKLELGIESVAHFRGKQFAIRTCMALIDYCLENGYEPVWACRLQNTNSFKLAQKIGFEPNLFLPFYKLPEV